MEVKTASIAARIRQLRDLIGVASLGETTSADHALAMYRGSIALAFSRAAATIAVRQENPAVMDSWEFRGFSQNGEDGIVDYLCSRVIEPNRFFIEIGASDGLENCSSWLALGRGYRGLMVEGEAEKLQRAQSGLQRLNWGLRFLNLMVTEDNVEFLLSAAATTSPDFFSLDIDGIDYYVMKRLLDAGLSPRVICVEYNSAFGPERSVTVKYQAPFDRRKLHPRGLYYGVSVSGWRNLLEPKGFRFLGVERNGVNAIFVREDAFAQAEFDGMQVVEFRENFAQLNQTGMTWQGQMETLGGLPLVAI